MKTTFNEVTPTGQNEHGRGYGATSTCNELELLGINSQVSASRDILSEILVYGRRAVPSRGTARLILPKARGRGYHLPVVPSPWYHPVVPSRVPCLSMVPMQYLRSCLGTITRVPSLGYHPELHAWVPSFTEGHTVCVF